MPFQLNPNLPEGFQDKVKQKKKMARKQEQERLRAIRLSRMIQDSDTEEQPAACNALKRHGKEV